ncbi:uncharacterized protein LOC119360602 [Triticum dicoccoides]|uniref:uncharacterized protein LOC119360602 n=1 Tax=Triticum dicoccoides TaxID=85692 RepID=UPI00188F808C|nr:uncharacterized protein LOC119360602 [Triticum dicoccoides]
MRGSRSTLSLPPFSRRRRTISFLLLQLLVAAKQAAALAATALALGMSSVTDLDCSLPSSPMDPFFDPITSCDRRRGVGSKLSGASSPPPAKQQLQQQCGADAILDMLGAKTPLPPRDWLLHSVHMLPPLLL